MTDRGDGSLEPARDDLTTLKVDTKEKVMNQHDRDIGPDTGWRDPSTKPADTDRGTVGTGEGYAGQEFDSEGQADWRERQERRDLPADGTVSGSGAGAGGGDVGEDYDVGTPGGAAPGSGAGKTFSS